MDDGPPCRHSPAGTSAAAALGALLDRSLTQIAEAAADARCFDAATIRTVSDVWDNNTRPLFHTATAGPSRRRERHARFALAWMAGFGEHRRQWMVEQAGIAGCAIEPLIDRVASAVPRRDYLGHVMAMPGPLTRRTVAEWAADYDLGSATISRIAAERAGSRIAATVTLTVTRAYPAGDDGCAHPEPARLRLALDDVRDIAFVPRGGCGATLDIGPAGVALTVGRDTMIRAARATGSPDDRQWHLSATGRRADVTAPPRDEQPHATAAPAGGRPGCGGVTAAMLVREAMLDIRSIRSPRRADHVPLRELCRAFDGAGSAVMDAGARRSGRGREAAFRGLIRDWALRGGPALAGWFEKALRAHDDGIDPSDILPAMPARTRRPPAEPDRRSGPPSHAALVMASWTAPDNGKPAGVADATLQLALPPRPGEPADAPWRLRTIACAEPGAFRLRGSAFDGTGPLVVTGKATSAGSVDLHRGALVVATPDGWSAALD